MVNKDERGGDLKSLIFQIKIRYDSIGRIWCPILNSYVHFTSEGRLHLIYKSNRKKRTVKEQFYKLRLFPLVVPILKSSTEIEDWRFRENDKVQFYAIAGIAGKNKIPIRVVIKRTGDGQFNYHSVMIDKKK